MNNTNLTTDTIKYKLTYTTPKIKCNIKSKKIYKACDNNKFYTRLSKDKDYGEAEFIFTCYNNYVMMNLVEKVIYI